MTRYITYYPAFDSIDNCGFMQPVNDFVLYSSDGTGEDMRKFTADLPETPEGDFGEKHGGVALAVECPEGQGFSAAELRVAANVYLRKLRIERGQTTSLRGV